MEHEVSVHLSKRGDKYRAFVMPYQVSIEADTLAGALAKVPAAIAEGERVTEEHNRWYSEAVARQRRDLEEWGKKDTYVHVSGSE